MREENAINRPIAGNAKLGQEVQFQSVEFGTGQQADIRVTVPERFRAMDGEIKAEIEEALLWTVQESPNQRPCI